MFFSVVSLLCIPFLAVGDELPPLIQILSPVQGELVRGQEVDVTFTTARSGVLCFLVDPDLRNPHSCTPFDPEDLASHSQVHLAKLAVGRRRLQLSFHEVEFVTEAGEVGFDETIASAFASVDFVVNPVTSMSGNEDRSRADLGKNEEQENEVGLMSSAGSMAAHKHDDRQSEEHAHNDFDESIHSHHNHGRHRLRLRDHGGGSGSVDGNNQRDSFVPAEALVDVTARRSRNDNGNPGNSNDDLVNGIYSDGKSYNINGGGGGGGGGGNSLQREVVVGIGGEEVRGDVGWDNHHGLGIRREGSQESPSSPRRLFFDAIYYSGLWSHGARDSGYAGGEEHAFQNTRMARRAVADVIASFSVESMVDLPCGEGLFFLGLLTLELNSTATKSTTARPTKQLASYEGIDVSVRAINAAVKRFSAFSTSATPSVLFRELDVLSPVAMQAFGGRDLVLCRLMMIHMSVDENLKVLHALESDARPKLVMLTTYLSGGGVEEGKHENTRDFPLVMGHHIDLLAPPYCLRPPDRLFYEGEGRAYLGLWDLSEAPLRDPCSGAGGVLCDQACRYKGPAVPTSGF